MHGCSAARRSLSWAVAALAVIALSACGGHAHRQWPLRSKLAACVRLWNRDDSNRHKEALAIVVQGALPDTGLRVTVDAPRGQPGELGTSRGVQIGPGRCVVGQERNTLFVHARGAWHMVNPTDSSDPALNVVYDADDKPNAQATNGQGKIELN